MELRVEQLSSNLCRIVVVGRWDIQGAASINLKLNEVTGSGRRIIMDMAGVDYLSSMGIRFLIMGAKTAGEHGGRMVLLSPTQLVSDVLTKAKIDQNIPVYHDFDEATQAVTA